MFRFFALTENGLFFECKQSVFLLDESIRFLNYPIIYSNNVRTPIPVPPLGNPLYGVSR